LGEKKKRNSGSKKRRGKKETKREGERRVWEWTSPMPEEEGGLGGDSVGEEERG